MNKEVKYTIRVNNKTNDYVKKRAKEMEISISEYIRQLILFEMRCLNDTTKSNA